jgi:S-adenosylmethionine:tRNA ribosyltransferase-isomerase
LRLSDFDYQLPEQLIAQQPPTERAGSRLLDARSAFVDRFVRDLPQLMDRDDLLVFNDTKVVKARLKGRRDTGGAVEIMIERVVDAFNARAMLRASHAPKSGSRLHLSDGSTLEVVGRENEFYQVRSDEPFYPLLERLGSLPLPPYIAHDPGREDDERYQTIYAKHEGAVAAPTAGLHFDQALLAALDERGVRRATLTLHVGAGTFLPVRHDDLSKHVMHNERYEIPADLPAAVLQAQAKGRRVVAIGTTVLRALESASAEDGALRAGPASTELFITPGYRFKTVDRLFTNFHLPRSTLLMLVSAFAGVDHIKAAYAHAVASQYRFFSYGDAMLLDRV